MTLSTLMFLAGFLFLASTLSAESGNQEAKKTPEQELGDAIAKYLAKAEKTPEK